MSTQTRQALWRDVYRILHEHNGKLNHAQGVVSLDAVKAWACRVWVRLRKLRNDSDGLMIPVRDLAQVIWELTNELSIHIPAEALRLLEKYYATPESPVPSLQEEHRAISPGEPAPGQGSGTGVP